MSSDGAEQAPQQHKEMDMSQETMEWLNQHTMIGYADKRDNWAAAGGWVRQGENGLMVPWHAQEGYENAFAGPIPVEAVVNTLFPFLAESRPVYTKAPCGINEAEGVGDDGQPYRWVMLDEYQAIVKDTTNEPFAVFKQSYEIHQYKEWLIDNVARLLDDQGESGIESALTLKNDGVACVTVMLSDAIEGDAGYPILTRLMAYTSMNGQHTTGYIKTPYSPVCDNSMTALIAGGSAERKLKYKHTKGSTLRIADAREALSILYKQGDEMVEFFDKLATWDVTNAQVKQVIQTVVPVEAPKVEDGRVTNQRKITLAENKQAEIALTYKRDPRVTKWDGTALGVLQAFNTWDQQVRGGLKSERVERNTLNMLGSVDAEFDALVMASLSDVTGVSLVKQDGGLELVKV
jgi:phage/plasmid-like protein (TIGR03299 family)